MNILITGSYGLVGKLISAELREQYRVICLDKKLGADILSDPIEQYLKDVDTIIHLAANPNPFINEEEAQKNIEISRALIKASRDYSIKRIINASSINVYSYIDLLESGQRLTSQTPLSPNLRFGNGKYGNAKIEVERLFKEYCKTREISLLNLRLGCVTPYNLPCIQEDGHIEPADYEIHLRHEDLLKIIKQGLEYKGIGSYVCVSKKNGLVDDSIRFPLD